MPGICTYISPEGLQDATGRHRMPQDAAGCSRTPQDAAGCHRMQQNKGKQNKLE